MLSVKHIWQQLAAGFGHKWVRIALSNLVLLLVGLFTNLWSSDISAAPASGLVQHLKSPYVFVLVLLLGANTAMQIALEPTAGFRTKRDFRETLRREVSDELVSAMRQVIREGHHAFLTADEVKTILELDDE